MDSAYRVGTSFYVGIPRSTQRTPSDCVRMALDLGVTDYFTSLKMPEADVLADLGELRAVGQLQRAYPSMTVMADFDPRVFSRIGGDVRHLDRVRELGLTHLRLDGGFGPEEIVQLVEAGRTAGIEVVLNAAPLTEQALQDLQTAGVSLEGRVAVHNYYPRLDSGVTEAFVDQKSRLLARYGLVVMGFVASQHHRRFMTREGLPTLERHRTVSPHRAAAEWFTRRWASTVYIGDQTDDADELTRLVEMARDPRMLLRVHVHPGAREPEKAVAFGRIHTHLRGDFAVMYRARADRQQPVAQQIEPQLNPAPRPRGTVGVDNVLYPRFAGELHIMREDRPADPRVNVVGEVVDADLPFLASLGPNVRFALEPM